MLALPRLQAAPPNHKASAQAKGGPARGFASLLSSLLGPGQRASGVSDKPAQAKAAPKPGASREAAAAAEPGTALAGPKAQAQSKAPLAEKRNIAASEADSEPRAVKPEKKRLVDQASEPLQAPAAIAAAPRAARLTGEKADAGPSADKVPGNEGQGRDIGEGRGAEGARKPKVSVVDMRLKAAREGNRRERAEPEAKVAGQEAKAIEARDALRQASSPEQGPLKTDAPETGAAEPASKPASLADSLAARLREGAADIVRSAQIVLRDGDAGLIRLRLEPESLGSVKIELKMTDKQISGKIVVESDIAGEAFRSSLDSLRDAFAESGFETTSLELEIRNGMASGGGRGNGGGPGAEADGAGPYFSRSLRSLSESVPEAPPLASPLAARAGNPGAVDLIV